MTDKQRIELEAIIRSLENTLDEVDGDESKINIHDISVETTVLIKDLLANYLKKRSK